ncbi:MAG TPA: DNA polymerase sliding clamp [Methanocorpusculum sp.]|nr:DNA polymerase sliding clamp [Methanocorpusculum sp.]HJJ92500.1 DNA polymerase sliding clamp [Methanocorpusculum sp.]
MLKAILNADIFRETIDAVSALVNECRLHVDECGIRTITVDTSNVAMVSLELESGAFSSYVAEPVELGLDIEKIRAMIGMIGKTDSVALELDDTGKKLKISFGGYEYSVTLLEPKTIRKDPNTPNLDLPAVFEVDGSMFYDAIKASAMVSDKISLSVNPDTLIFTMNADGDSARIKRELAGADVHYLSCAAVRSLFSLDYLKDMGKSIGKADKVQICLGNDHPVQFSFVYADGKGKIGYLLAPRIEAE